jgi:transposase
VPSPRCWNGSFPRHRYEEIFAALIVPPLAGSLTAVLDQRQLLAGRIEELLEAHLLSKVLTSMPGIGVRTGARLLIEVGDGSTFPTTGHIAASAGLASATWTSGSSIRGEPPRGEEDRPGQAPHPGPALPR